MKIIRLAIIEDEVLIQESLKIFFDSVPHMVCVKASISVEDFLNELPALEILPDVLLLDINLVGMTGIEGIPLLLNEIPDLDIIMLTTFEDNDSIFKALCAGACSYLSKKTSLKKIQEAVEVVQDGGSYMSPSIARKIVNHYAPKATKKSTLSPRETDVVNGIVAGKSYQQIADDLFVSLNTVRTHIKHIYKELGINNKAALIKKSYDGEL
ncbi:MAG: DNA-binding response regulator [Flavobacteriaceae bacterium]|nr:DNA-binding response regulator [Flavobacteriaceae bacterium]